MKTQLCKVGRMPGFNAELTLRVNHSPYLNEYDGPVQFSVHEVRLADNICRGGDGSRCSCFGDCEATKTGCHCLPTTKTVHG